MNLPYQADLPTHLLAACFNKTSATYKFYWFLAVLGHVEQGESQLSKQALFADMLAHAWYTVNYFHVSFGKQDKLQQAIEQVRITEHLTIDAELGHISTTLRQTSHPHTRKALRYFDSEVPHRFLSPWFRAEDKRLAYAFSQSFTGECLYALYADHIVINPAWAAYLQRNARVLKDFCYWNLALYLQGRNPNVPDIPNKLIKAPVRKSLTEQRKKFWDIVIGELGSVDCIYTNTRLWPGRYAVEHFIPYAFVSHDLIWNLIPADPAFNSVKSDKLPWLDRYFEPFYQLQQQAVAIIYDKLPKSRFLEEYLTIIPDLSATRQLFSAADKQRYREQLQPLITIAANNGFEYLPR
ncbi:hypothetical protein HH214_06150 [Mucilaginibacter robiniae]|uniref:HNH nuclease domain-containing protein n=1 Tax=Mucilaginibacter robiniae TaxID=2728022 RepID=A0A7L5E7N3_9SPHI|nr:HNH endonuclease domain-containing protein [Mucilaginibacter robiniae]QJD98319.1 hypothetical protein HH214_06150 [Mucilaginibacter robiniae]